MDKGLKQAFYKRGNTNELSSGPNLIKPNI